MYVVMLSVMIVVVLVLIVCWFCCDCCNSGLCLFGFDIVMDGVVGW